MFINYAIGDYLILVSVCGRKVSDAQKLAYGANKTTKIEYPWITAVYQKDESDNFINVCGGSIISRKVVLTGKYLK